MMNKFVAIPARLQREDLTDAEMEELAQYGSKPMTEGEALQYQMDAANAVKEKEQEEKNQIVASLRAQLAEIDLKSIRAIRANETERLQELEAQAVNIRAKLNDEI